MALSKNRVFLITEKSKLTTPADDLPVLPSKESANERHDLRNARRELASGRSLCVNGQSDDAQLRGLFIDLLRAREPAVRRAAKYLVDTQQPDGSWKALSRQAFSTKPDMMTPVTVHWGTAWATIGLLTTIEKAD